MTIDKNGDDKQRLKCIEIKEGLKKTIKNFLANDPKSSVRINISSAYGFQTYGYEAKLFLEMLDIDCKKIKITKK